MEHLSLTNQFSDLSLSPDGRKIVFSARGEIFAASARDGGDAVRVTRSSRARVPDRMGARTAGASSMFRSATARPHVFLYDFTTSRETQVTRADVGDAAPGFSPDGKQLAFIRDGKELHVMGADFKEDRVIVAGFMGRGQRGLAWSPDSRWLAYVGLNTKSFRNVFAVPAAGGESRILSAVPNGSTGNLSWSPDGTYIIFNTNQRTEEAQVVRVDLILRTPKFREDLFRDLFREEPPRTAGQAAAGGAARETRRPEPKPVEIVFDDIRQRSSFLSVGVSVNSQIISPDGKWLLLTASAAGQQNLYTYPLDETARGPAVARQLTSSAGSKSEAQFSPDSREVYFLEGGRISVIGVDNRQTRPVK